MGAEIERFCPVIGTDQQPDGTWIVRTHLRKADHYSGNILAPLGFDSCIRVSMCHYNSVDEVARFLATMKQITG